MVLWSGISFITEAKRLNDVNVRHKIYNTPDAQVRSSASPLLLSQIDTCNRLSQQYEVVIHSISRG
jgi:hypothetical protein